MDVFKLTTTNEVAAISNEKLNNIVASLMWEKNDDLDLMVFYKTKEGDEGSVYSGDIPGGDFGNLDEFPYISCGDGGVDDESETVLSYEKMYMKDLSSFEEIFFVVTNYSDLVLKKQINFNEYKGVMKIAPKYADTDIQKRYVLRLSSEEKGDVLVLGSISAEDGFLLVKNINKVLTLEQFSEIPGTKNFKR